jgi:tryptophan synthase beta subunit
MNPFDAITRIIRDHLTEVDTAYFVEAVCETAGPLPNAEILQVVQAMPQREIARLLMLALADRLSDDYALAVGPIARLSDQN